MIHQVIQFPEGGATVDDGNAALFSESPTGCFTNDGSIHFVETIVELTKENFILTAGSSLTV
jgi:hypothetical protein